VRFRLARGIYRSAAEGMLRGTKPVHIVSLAVLLLAASLSLVVKAATAPIARAALIHFTLQSRLPTIEALVDQTPVTLVLDLGMYKPIALSTSALETVPVLFTGLADRYRDGSGTLFVQRAFIVRNLVIDSLRLSQVPGVEFNTNEEQAGTIGFGLLKEYVMIFDYTQSELRLFPIGTRLRSLPQCGPKAYPVEVLRGVLRTKVETDRGDQIFQFDTGSTNSLLRPSSIGLKSNYKTSSATLSKFKLLGKDFGKTKISLSEFHAPNVDGVLGTDFLQSRVVCFDIANLEATIR
jgi:hypothetical protein